MTSAAGLSGPGAAVMPADGRGSIVGSSITRSIAGMGMETGTETETAAASAFSGSGSASDADAGSTADADAGSASDTGKTGSKRSPRVGPGVPFGEVLGIVGDRVQPFQRPAARLDVGNLLADPLGLQGAQEQIGAILLDRLDPCRAACLSASSSSASGRKSVSRRGSRPGLNPFSSPDR